MKIRTLYPLSAKDKQEMMKSIFPDTSSAKEITEIRKTCQQFLLRLDEQSQAQTMLAEKLEQITRTVNEQEKKIRQFQKMADYLYESTASSLENINALQSKNNSRLDEQGQAQVLLTEKLEQITQTMDEQEKKTKQLQKMADYLHESTSSMDEHKKEIQQLQKMADYLYESTASSLENIKSLQSKNDSRLDDQEKKVQQLYKMTEFLYDSVHQKVDQPVAQPSAPKPPAAQPLVDGKKEVKEISDSWEQILASIKDGSYRTKYAIGNYKPLDLGSEGIVEMQIAGFDAEPLADGSGMAAITWISRNGLKTTHCMNPDIQKGKIGTGAIGGWKTSEMRTYLDQTIKPLMPAVVRNAVKKVKKYSSSRTINKKMLYNAETSDYLWIPSVREVTGERDREEKSAVYYRSMFDNNKSRSKKASWWWLRSVDNSSNNAFYGVGSSGYITNRYANITGSVVLGFCT